MKRGKEMSKDSAHPADRKDLRTMSQPEDPRTMSHPEDPEDLRTMSQPGEFEGLEGLEGLEGGPILSKPPASSHKNCGKAQ